MSTRIATVRRLLRVATFWAAALVAACGGGDASTRLVTVQHSPGDFPSGSSHVEYLFLGEVGEWVALAAEYGLNGGNLVEVPTDTTGLLVRAHSEEHEMLAEQLYLVSPAGEAATATSFSRWMTQDQRIQASALYQITIPGAHDAGMGKIDKCSFYANAKTTQTQDSSIAGMLHNGIRYFDLRPMYAGLDLRVQDREMRLGHYSWVGNTIDIGIYKFTLRNEGCTGYAVAAALDDVRDFMAGSDNREVVILKMSHFQNLRTHDNSSSHFDPADIAELERMVKEKLGAYLLIGNPDFRTAPISQLTASGPKVIVTFDVGGHDGSGGIYSQSDLHLYDEYANKASYDAMKKDQFGKMAVSAQRMDPIPVQEWIDLYLCNTMVGPISEQCYKRAEAAYANQWRLYPYFVLSWTLTQSEHQMIGCTVGTTEPIRLALALAGYACTTLPELGKKANGHLPDVLAEAKAKRRYPNVLYVDQASAQATATAIAINRLH